jgi:hypothetical protein
MNDLKTQLSAFVKKFEAITSFVARHTVLVFFMIASLAILAALLQSRSYLDPARDEQIYSEGVSGIQYKTIDEETLDALLASEQDEQIEVNPALVPGRDNPFAE